MSSNYTATKLINSIRNLGTIPSEGTLGLKDSDLLLHINEAIKSITSKIVGIREEYFVKRDRIPLVSGVSRYRIPYRAYLGRIRQVYYVNSSSERVPLPCIHKEELEFYSRQSADNSPVGYYLEENFVSLVPDFNTRFAGSLEIAYPFRPSELVMEVDTRVISNINYGTKTITLSEDVPSTWTNVSVFDIHYNLSGSEVKLWDITPVSVSGNVIVFSDALDGSQAFHTSVNINDYVCLSEQCAVLPLSQDLHSTLIRAVALRIAESEGDQAIAEIHKGLLDEELQTHISTMEERNEGEPLRITGHGGTLRGLRRGKFR